MHAWLCFRDHLGPRFFAFLQSIIDNRYDMVARFLSILACGRKKGRFGLVPSYARRVRNLENQQGTGRLHVSNGGWEVKMSKQNGRDDDKAVQKQTQGSRRQKKAAR